MNLNQQHSRCTGAIISPLFFNAPQFLRSRNAPGKLPTMEEKRGEETDEREQEAILCRNCLLVVTDTSERLTVEGHHHHTFANPQGIVFDIGCFRRGVGCRYSGDLTSEMSWFRGFCWRFAFCGKCLSQLGWQFLPNTEGEGFWGLILNRLVIPF
jgi:hypothetical protein